MAGLSSSPSNNDPRARTVSDQEVDMPNTLANSGLVVGGDRMFWQNVLGNSGFDLRRELN